MSRNMSIVGILIVVMVIVLIVVVIMLTVMVRDAVLIKLWTLPDGICLILVAGVLRRFRYETEVCATHMDGFAETVYDMAGS